MERPKAETESVTVTRKVAKNKERVLCPPPGPRRMLPLPPVARAPPALPPLNEVKLAAIAVALNIRMRSADMPAVMQERAFRFTRALLDATHDSETRKLNPTRIAMSLKKEFDAMYGLAWHCIVGKSFGSFVTHSSGGFVYFSVDNLSFLLFKTEVQPVKKPLPSRKLNVLANVKLM